MGLLRKIIWESTVTDAFDGLSDQIMNEAVVEYYLHGRSTKTWTRAWNMVECMWWARIKYSIHLCSCSLHSPLHHLTILHPLLVKYFYCYIFSHFFVYSYHCEVQPSNINILAWYAIINKHFHRRKLLSSIRVQPCDLRILDPPIPPMLPS